MTMDISTLSVEELNSLLEKLPAEIKRREADEKKRIRKEVEELIANSGYSLNDLLGDAAEKVAKVKKPVRVKYRTPDGGEWTGRGRKPKFIVEFIAQGGTLEQLAV
jgi:DNA-binding protein H-NS